MIQSTKTPRFIIVFALLILLVSACTPEAPAPTQAPQVSTPTIDTMAITQTFQALVTAARETVVADLTAQAPEASPTVPPTDTPVIITATVGDAAPTQQATAAVPTATTAPIQQVSPTGPAFTATVTNTTCTIVSQSPAFGQDFDPREDLDLRWTLRNTSSQQWNQGDVDYVFISGTDFHKQATYDLGETVQPNGEVDIVVDVTAPSLPGRYSATWAVVRGGQRLCTMSATIDVVD